jgi:hypothetical protein
MTAILSLISKFLPVILPFLGKLFPDNEKIQIIKAQAALKDAESFDRGRIPPRYLAQYVLIGFLAACGIVLLVSVFVPLGGVGTLIEHLRNLVGISGDIMGGGQ